jgi:hypothetical protein
MLGVKSFEVNSRHNLMFPWRDVQRRPIHKGSIAQIKKVQLPFQSLLYLFATNLYSGQ